MRLLSELELEELYGRRECTHSQHAFPVDDFNVDDIE